ncbi:DUF6053 domain-containing protein [Lysobacter enzymogenes]
MRGGAATGNKSIEPEGPPTKAKASALVVSVLVGQFVRRRLSQQPLL